MTLYMAILYCFLKFSKYGNINLAFYFIKINKYIIRIKYNRSKFYTLYNKLFHYMFILLYIFQK